MNMSEFIKFYNYESRQAISVRFYKISSVITLKVIEYNLGLGAIEVVERTSLKTRHSIYGQVFEVNAHKQYDKRID